MTSKITYWVATIFLAIGMQAGGVQQVLQTGGVVDIVRHLGYPLYLLFIIGAWKILGVVALLITNIPLLKEWAYAGFFLALSGAAISHMALNQSVNEVLPSLVLLMVTVLSWYFRPENRKINSVNQ